MNKKRLIVSTIGDPLLASTWFGTPHNITKALTDLNIEIIGIDASVKNQNTNRIYRVINRILGYGVDDQTVAPLDRLTADCFQTRHKSIKVNKG